MTHLLTAELRQHVEHLANVPRPPGSPEHRRAQAYLTHTLKAAGFGLVPEHGVAAEGFRYTNLLTEPVPGDPTLPLFIVAAHYDSIADSPGADDNASGLATLIELARWIRPRLDGASHKARLQLAAYDLEEYGCLGSWAHARRLKEGGTQVTGMISLEMLGYCDRRPGSQQLPPALAGHYPNSGDFIGIVGTESSDTLLHTVVAAMKSVPGLPVESMAIPGNGMILPQTRLSDHSSFWDHGMPALMITDTSFFRNPHYHRDSDTPDTLDYDFLAKVTQGVCAAAWKIVAV